MSIALNAFDQYSQAENRLTHALGVTLERSKEFRAIFLKELAGNPKIGRDAEVTLQMAAGTVEVNGEKCGIPDLAIIDSDDRGTIVEAKLGAPLTWQQLASHERRAERNGVQVQTALAITGRDKDRDTLAGWQKAKQLSPAWQHTTWQEIYRLACRHIGVSSWVKELRDYMQIMASSLDEAKMGADVKIIEFSGITPEMQENYTPAIAKRLLRSLMDEMRSDKAFLKSIGIPANEPTRNRKAIKNNMRVWDFLSPLGEDDGFTDAHHFTIAIHPDRMEAMLTIPNSAARKLVSYAKSIEADEFAALTDRYVETIQTAGIIKAGGRPCINIVQRRYQIRSEYATDGHAEFDLRVSGGASADGIEPAIKKQSEWLEFCHQLISNKGANIQFQIGVRFPYNRCMATQDRAIIALIKQALQATMPIVKNLNY